MLVRSNEVTETDLPVNERRHQMLPKPLPSLSATLVGLLFSLLLTPPTSADSCPPAGPNCYCSGGWCFRQLRFNEQKYVHLEIEVRPGGGGDDWFVNIAQPPEQHEFDDRGPIYVRRSKSGPTKFSAQACERQGALGSSCSDWSNFVLAEPSGQQLEFCQDYADKAAAAERENVKLNCGYTGPRWTTDPKENYNACAASPAADIWPNETVARANDLQTCTNQKAALPDWSAIERTQNLCKDRCACCASGNCADTSICISKSASVDPKGYYGCFNTCTSHPPK